jgi:hypothetical protein
MKRGIRTVVLLTSIDQDVLQYVDHDYRSLLRTIWFGYYVL